MKKILTIILILAVIIGGYLIYDRYIKGFTGGQSQKLAPVVAVYVDDNSSTSTGRVYIFR